MSCVDRHGRPETISHLPARLIAAGNVCAAVGCCSKNTAVPLLEGITLGESIIWQNLCVYHQSVACFVALWVSVLISATTDMSPTGDLLVTSVLLGKCLSELAWEPSCVVLAWHCAQINFRPSLLWTLFPWYAELCSSMNAGAAAACAWIPGHAGPGVGWEKD